MVETRLHVFSATVPTLLHNIRAHQSRTSCPSTVTSRAKSASSALVASEREIVGEYPKRLVVAQGAYGPEVTSVEGEDRVRVVVGGERHVDRVGEVEVQRTVADTDGL